MNPQPNQPNAVVIWLPRADEYALAHALGMVDCDVDTLGEIVTATQEQTARDLPGVPVRVHRWHIWRVVRAMVAAGATNTPDGRATAYRRLSHEPA